MNDPFAPAQHFPAGWYPTSDGQMERFWDGKVWTDAYRPRAANPPGYSAYQPGYGQPHQAYGQALAPTHGPAVASMVLGIVSLVLFLFGIVTGIIGLVLGASSLKHCQPRGPKRGRGMAIAGITLSLIALGLWLIILLASNGSRGF